uniref:EFhand_Ca_insen domain-containing protein n=1 Tax=Rhodnius prolixus TaxID=13249 RepID=T1HHH6_RHOPR
MEKLMASFSALLDSKNYVTREDFYGMEAKINELQDENKVLKKEIENLKMHDKLQEAQLRE